ncbi:hypothetical protein GIB67_014069 [Kingdonia uniflora]|uniref:Protein kinase domain-containing protein n=1 Tax=Kingdonia uniflora TaxID=39325 RepID=A0A7J7KXD0_9MAGN|nr:hypothetical protein GIB67_014069 [Kingdonia uniflora]
MLKGAMEVLLGEEGLSNGCLYARWEKCGHQPHEFNVVASCWAREINDLSPNSTIEGISEKDVGMPALRHITGTPLNGIGTEGVGEGTQGFRHAKTRHGKILAGTRPYVPPRLQRPPTPPQWDDAEQRRYGDMYGFHDRRGRDRNNTLNNFGRRRLVIILAVVSSAVAILLITAAGLFFGKRELARRRKEKKQLGVLTTTIKKSELNFRYEVLERATNYFHCSNKLGQGGSGSVYKGILPDGKAVAVKRLVFTTRQWVDLFFNEVNLISDVNHKNLVKLLGCSITGPESLLVYEYVPNQSLQDHLFGKNSSRQLSWEVRYNIIVGTAEGLTYLHEESKLRIIHRDIKLSNVLLDENLTAKIADFGLARLFPEDKTHISTAIAGTLGYMAPEYVVRGKLTEKADVYSFGVLVIEVVSGRRNNSFSQDSVSILQMVWNYYGSGRLCEAVDPSLEGVFQESEAARVLQIGLLCTQASADLRPSMSMVVKMLTDNFDIPNPSQPPFLNSNNVKPLLIQQGSSNSRTESLTQSSGNSMTQSLIEPR